MKENIKFKLALRDNEVIHVSELNKDEKGLKCNCICPDCNESLIAKLGEIKTWHFAHNANSKCIGCGESLVHNYAKKIIKENGYIFVPAKKKTRVNFTNVVLEHRENDTIVDVLGTTEKSEIAIEIFYKHKVPVEKIEKLSNYYNYVLEIDIPRDIYIPDKEKFKKLLLEEYNREWIVFNKNTNKGLMELEIKFKKLIENIDKYEEVERNRIHEIKRERYELKKLKENYKEKEKELNELEKKIDDISNGVEEEKLKNGISELEFKYNNLNSEIFIIEELEAKKESLGKEEKELINEINTMKNEINTMKMEIERLSKKKSELESEITNLIDKGIQLKML